MRYLLCLILVLLASPVWAMEHHINTLQTRQGNAIGGVTVTVYLTGTTTLATIFSDNGVTAKANPFLSDANGYYHFFASNGVYDITFVRSGYTFDIPFTRIALFDVNDGGGGGGSSSFSGLLSGTNNTAAMIVGSGASLNFTGSGSINASLLNGSSVVAVASGGTNLSTAPDDSVLLGNGATWQARLLPNCSGLTSKLLYTTATNAFSCGTDAGGGAFDTIGSGINTTASMTVGTGGTLTYSGTGILNASMFRGNTSIAIADGGTGLSVPTDDAVLLGNGTIWAATALPSCSNATSSKLLYNVSTNAFSCGTDQSSGGGTTFDTIGSGSNSTATMTVDSGGSLVPSGTGIVAATAARPAVTTVNAGNSPYTVLTTDYFILCDTTAAPRIITLIAATNKQILRVKNLGSNTCTVNRAGADTIDTGTSAILRNQFDAIDLVSDASASWSVF